MTYPQAIVAAAGLIALAILFSFPRYEIVQSPTWNVVWRVNTRTGETAYCTQGEGACFALKDKEFAEDHSTK